MKNHIECLTPSKQGHAMLILTYPYLTSVHPLQQSFRPVSGADRHLELTVHIDVVGGNRPTIDSERGCPRNQQTAREPLFQSQFLWKLNI